MTERSRKELLITHSLGMMRAILCNWQCGLIVEGLYSTINLLFLSCYFFFIISYLHLIAYFFLYLFACARTHAHITQTSLNVVQWLDMLMPNLFFFIFYSLLGRENKLENLCSNILLKNTQLPPTSLRETFRCALCFPLSNKINTTKLTTVTKEQLRS